MKKGIAIVSLLILMVFALTGCGCEHEWKEATCELPKTCSKCQETEGEALGHTWKDADCTAPQTCTLCSVTQGAALGHTQGKWKAGEPDYVEAAIVSTRSCTICGEELEEKTEPLKKLYMKGRMLTTPEEFTERLNKTFAERFETNMKAELTAPEGDLGVGLYQDDRYAGCILFFASDAGNPVTEEYKDELCFIRSMGIINDVSSHMNAYMDLMLGLILTCDPTLEFSEALEIGQASSDQGYAEMNGIVYFTNYSGADVYCGFEVVG